MHFLDEGQGTPLVMVHGNPTWSFYWRHLVSAFRDEYRVIVPDHIGCGLSDKPRDYPYTLSQHIANLVELWDHLEIESATVLVHDWGGPIGIGAAIQRPERVSRLVIFNTALFPPPYVPLRIKLCRTPILGRLAIRGLNLFARAAIHMAPARHHRLDDVTRAGLLAPYDSWHNRVGIDGFVGDIPLTASHPSWKVLADIESNLSQLQQPTQIIWGMQDWCFREPCLLRISQHFPHASIERYADAGHYVIEDKQEQIEQCLIRFFKST